MVEPVLLVVATLTSLSSYLPRRMLWGIAVPILRVGTILLHLPTPKIVLSGTGETVLIVAATENTLTTTLPSRR
jgi:hypothetical protein